MSSPESPSSAQDLILQHLPLVKKIAGYLFSLRHFDGVPFEEYVQFGIEGLMQAVQRYSGDRGARFETYASYRIKGAIMSGLEKSTEINQQVATLRRVQQERIASILDRAPSPAPAPTAFDRLMEVSIGLAVSFMLEDTALYHDGETTHWDDGAANIAYKQLQARLQMAMADLSDGERAVLEQHYFQHDSFALIAESLSITKGRVSQLHRAGLNKLRTALAVHRLGELVG